MGVSDIFSKRQKRLRGDIPDVYTYSDLPEPLRTQIVHIWNDIFGSYRSYGMSGLTERAFEFMVKTLRREYGVFDLLGRADRRDHFMEELIQFLLSEKNVERVLDAVEISFSLMENMASHGQVGAEAVEEAIGELNTRMKEHGVGYAYSKGEVFRVDSELIHAEAVKPALRLLNVDHYAGAQDEFLSAHSHYRHGNAKEALNDALKAFESTMKSICEKRSWTHGKQANARDLIKACLENKLIPPFWEQHYSALRSLLESGVPTGRNRLSGHGQGAQPMEVPNYLVAYMLHMTASAIVFLAEAERALPDG